MENETGPEWLQRLMQQYGTALLRMCAVFLHDAFLAQDAVQEAFWRTYRRRETFRGECSEKSWLTGIAVNICRDYQRTAWLRHVDRRVAVECLPEPESAAVFPDHTVLNAIYCLPARYREVILLRYYLGCSIQETAEALHVSASAVKQRQRKGNELLRERLKEWYFDEE